MKAFGVLEDKKARTSLRLPETVLAKISESMSKNGYGAKQRSRWICEALADLIKIEGYCELIAEEFMDKGGNEVIPVTLDDKSSGLLAGAIKSYAEKFQVDVIDQSVVLRTAIIQRLIRESGGVIT